MGDELSAAERKVRSTFWTGFLEAHEVDTDRWHRDVCEVCGGTLPLASEPGDCDRDDCPALLCPDCDTRWPTGTNACPGCGLTVEAVAQRIADRRTP